MCYNNADRNQSDDTKPSIRCRLMSLNIIFQRSRSPAYFCVWVWQSYIIDKKSSHSNIIEDILHCLTSNFFFFSKITLCQSVCKSSTLFSFTNHSNIFRPSPKYKQILMQQTLIKFINDQNKFVKCNTQHICSQERMDCKSQKHASHYYREKVQWVVPTHRCPHCYILHTCLSLAKDRT